ncbi:presequence protease 2, chloroplastic/mitochondrial, partial [Cyclospora cayetanensis]|uniref:Presequence protease 2, chloroplastic/mitochondrial n=1 Tax=Cyclospora cayetanensis TaxID=88456 RepID=A0A6P6RS40_9EIME
MQRSACVRPFPAFVRPGVLDLSLAPCLVSPQAMKDKAAELFCLIDKVLTDANFAASSRAIEILKESLSTVESSIQSAGHRAAAKRIFAVQTATGFVGELRGGVSYRDTLLGLLQEAQSDWPSVEKRLRSIRSRLLQRENFIVNLTGDSGALAAAADGRGGAALISLLAALPVGDAAAAEAAAATAAAHASGEEGATVQIFTSALGNRGFDRESQWVKEIRADHLLNRTVREALLIPTKVNFVSQGGRMASSGSSLRGQDFVVAASISTHHLWKKVREIGGAYGAGFVFDASGLFCFTSFRDPQLVKTLRAYKETPAFLRKWAASMTESDVRRAIIAVLRDLDAPLPSDQKGTKSLWQLIARQTEAHRRQFRKETLSTIEELDLRLSFLLSYHE